MSATTQTAKRRPNLFESNVFDVETIFLFPWAVQFKTLKMFGFIEMLVFLAILIVGYVWIWKKGALEWI